MSQSLSQVLKNIREGKYEKPKVSGRQLGAPDGVWPNHNPFDVPAQKDDWRDEPKD